MSSNPKFLFQGLILLLAIVIFAFAVLFLRIYTGKTLRALLVDHKRLAVYSLGSAFILFIVVFLVLVLINN